MKRCKRCRAIIELAKKDFRKGYSNDNLKTINENSFKKGLCISCFHKEMKCVRK